MARGFAKRLVICFTLVSLSFFGFSQSEICGDGLDNDLDGFIDCYDSDCSGDITCDGNIAGNIQPICHVAPPPTTFSTRVKWVTSVLLMDARQTPAVGDIDGDGMPEVIGKHWTTDNSLYVFDGATGALELTINSPQTDVLNDGVAIADVDGDGTGEIFLVSDDVQTDPADERRLYRFEHDGTLAWRSTDVVGIDGSHDKWFPSLADFNQDGTPEIYMGNFIFNVATGALIGSGNSAYSKGILAQSDLYEAIAAAADVLPDAFCADCAGLELVCGNSVYSVNIGAGTVTREVLAPGVYDGYTSIADMDLDGDLDAVVASLVTPTTGPELVYVWDLQTPTIMATFTMDSASSANPASTSTNIGLPNIADFDGDGYPEIGTTAEHLYVVMDYDIANDTLIELWSREVAEESGRAGSSVFDFEGDGVNEVLFRDEDTLYIFDGLTGASKASFLCASGTRSELPVVVDVDADGTADIVCGCGGTNGNITVFEADQSVWVGTREVWNQHNYFVTNVNDDLTIPIVQQQHHLAFPSGARPLNGYQMQSPLLLADGLPVLRASDDTVQNIHPVSDITYSNCNTGAALTQVTYTVCNSGEAFLPEHTPVAFYRGNPYVAGATLIALDSVPARIEPSSCLTLSFDLPVTAGSYPFDLYVQVNDDGTGTLPLAALPGVHVECDSTNNVKLVSISDCPLPVQWLSFSAHRTNEGVWLEWETLEDGHSDHYRVERSTDGLDWAALAVKSSVNNISAEAHYSFLDETTIPAQPETYYRIHQVDLNGESTTSEIRSIQWEGEPTWGLQVYPNPSGGTFRVSWPVIQRGNHLLELYDLGGKLIYSNETLLEMGPVERDLSLNLAPGHYLLRLRSNYGTESHRIQVQ